jgi:hypothetical protein
MEENRPGRIRITGRTSEQRDVLGSVNCSYLGWTSNEVALFPGKSEGLKERLSESRLLASGTWFHELEGVLDLRMIEHSKGSGCCVYCTYIYLWVRVSAKPDNFHLSRQPVL